MTYVEKVLQPGETLRFVTRLHWVVYLTGAILILIGAVLAIILWILFPDSNGGVGVPSLIVFVIGAVLGILSLLGAWFRRWTTEFAVTDRRIIYKRGFISRRTIEMNMNKVETVDVVQSVTGRLMNYGNIVVRGTGSTFEPMRMISRPLEFRSHVIAG